jgi:hypothetical protein
MIDALLVGGGMFLASLVLYAGATGLLVQLLVLFIRKHHDAISVCKSTAVMIAAVLVTATMHLTEVALWALAYRLCGEIPTFEQAFYLSAQNYTALGYGDVLLPRPWRLLGPLQAINGLLLFGLSTALLFAAMSHLIALRLQDHPDLPPSLKVEPGNDPRRQ